MASTKAPALELLEPTSEEYASGRNTLANSCQHLGKATSVVIYKINDSETAQRFDKTCRKKMKVSGWANMAHLGSENEVGNLSTRGFVFGKGMTGLEFRVGIISDQLIPKILDPSIEHTLVYSDLGIGRSYIEDCNLHVREIPDGYDSFYVPHKPLDRDQDGHFDVFEYNQAAHFDGREPSAYEHRYFLKDSSQMRPRYIIKFRLLGATALPLAYASSKEGSAESKEARDAKKPYDPLDEFSYFDPIAHKAVTLRDKMTLGTRSKVVLIPVDNAYKQALIDYTEKDLLIENKKEWLEAQLDVIDEKVRQVNVNYAEVVENVGAAARKAIAQMEDITKVKLEALLSAEVEMRREQEQIQWMEIVSKRTAQSTASAIEKALSAQKEGMGGMPAPPPGILNTTTGTNQGNNLLIGSSREINRAQLEFLECWKNTAKFRTAAGRYKPNDYLQCVKDIQANMRVRSNIELYGAKSGLAKPTLKSCVDSGDTTKIRGASSVADALRAVEASSFYSEAVQPMAGGLHPLLHTAVDMEMDKIRSLLTEVLRNPDPAPLPHVIQRPPNAHDDYTMPLLLDLVSKDGGVGGARKLADQMQEREERGGHFDLKKQYYTCMDELLGKPPVAAKDSPKSAEQIQKERLEDAKAKAVNAKAAQRMALQKAKDRKREKERKEEEERGQRALEEKERREREEELKAQTEYAEQQRALQDQQKIWKQQQNVEAARRAAATQGLLHPGHAMATTMAASPTLKGTYLGQGLKVMGASSSAGTITDSPTLGMYGKSVLASSGFGKDNMKGVHYSVNDLSDALKSFFGDMSSTSLSVAATKRKEKMAYSIFEDECQRMIDRLANGDILTVTAAENVYFSLPFFSHPPACDRLYSAVAHTSGEIISLDDLYEKCLVNSSPSILLVQSGDFVFGAYLSHPLRVSSSPQWMGSPACFVFSVSLDVKCAFHGRQAPPETITVTHALPASFKCEHDRLTIGNGDLIIKNDGNGESNLENCFGLGLAPESPEALTMLAGTHEFSIDNIEVWAISQKSA